MIPAGQIGEFRIEKPKWGTILWEGNTYWMDDSDKTNETQQFAVDKIKGKVLVGGLGLGCVVEKLNAKPEVAEIVVVEITQEVIDLVWPYLDVSKAKVVHMDLKDYPMDGFDYIYIDIWPNTGHESIPEWRELVEQFVAPDKALCWGERKKDDQLNNIT